MTTSHERLREAADDAISYMRHKPECPAGMWRFNEDTQQYDTPCGACTCALAAAKQKLTEAANTFRALASAQSDAEKGFDEYFNHVNEQYYWRRVTLDIHNREPWRSLAQQAYHTGHAQGVAAGLAASTELPDQLLDVNAICNQRDELITRCANLTAELAAQEAKCKELEAERPKRLCDYDPVEATIGDMVTNFGFDYTNFKFLAEGITRYNDALATAKAECEQLKDHCLDAIKVQNEAQADALELANEVRRLRPYREKYIEQCHNIRPGEFDEDFEKRRSDAVLNDRPAAVKAAMERYK